MTPDIMRLKTSNGSFTSNDAENVSILSAHFTKVFNSAVNIDWTVLENLKDKIMDMSLMNPLISCNLKMQ